MSSLLTEAMTAERLNVRKQTLACWRCTGRHPLKFVKIGRAVRYRVEDVEAFITNNTHGSTAAK